MCGVFGIYGHDEAAHLTYLGLHALQHRGQESAGIVATDGTQLKSYRAMGLVADVVVLGTDTVDCDNYIDQSKKPPWNRYPRNHDQSQFDARVIGNGSEDYTANSPRRPHGGILAMRRSYKATAGFHR